jgi:hypothetical protein
MTEKIINFQQRRQLEQAIAAFGTTTTELELVEQARRVAHGFPVDLVQAALLKHLETASSQIRGGLGHLAALLPSDEISTALRAVAANRQQSPLARMTAAAIAQRFLGIDFPAALTADLNSTDDAAFRSLLEALEEGKRNRHILLEYVQQMRELGEEVAFLVMDALEQVAPPDRVELLRLIAQDSRPGVAKEAIARLERLTTGEAAQPALRALHTLQAVLPTDLAGQVERTLRKLRMSGRRYDPPDATRWQALISPAEPNGAQTVWLVYRPEPQAAPGVLLGFVLIVGSGLLRFFGSERMETTLLPPDQPIGNLVTVTNDEGGSAVLLVAPFDYGRWLVAQALHSHRTNPQAPALADDYQLYHDLIWQFAPPLIDEGAQRFWHSTESYPAAELTLERAGSDASALFVHPAMEGWVMQSRAVVGALQPAARPDPALPKADFIALLLREIAKWPESNSLPAALAQGLRAQAAWLYYAGQAELAACAHRLAESMPRLPLTENPVLAQMLAAGLGRR